MSRPRSARGANAAGAGARTASPRGVYVQAPKSDIYVALLGVSLGAMIIGCILLVLVLNRYGFSTKVSDTSSPPTVTFASADRGKNLGKIHTVHLS